MIKLLQEIKKGNFPINLNCLWALLLIFFLTNNPRTALSQPADDTEGDFRVVNISCEDYTKMYKEFFKKNANETIQKFLNGQTDFRTLAIATGYFNSQYFIRPYTDTIYSLLKIQKDIDYRYYWNATLIALLDKKYLYRDSIIGPYNLQATAKYNKSYTKDRYWSTLHNLTDPSFKDEDIIDFNSPNKKLTMWNLYQLAREVIFVNDKELNELFWRAFSSEREIPATFYRYYGTDELDTGMVSVAFVFGCAYADYFFDPFLYNLLYNPLSVAQVNDVPFDAETYKDFIPIMEKYIYYVSCQKVKIPFLLKFKKPCEGMEKWYYQHHPLPAKYYSIPEECQGKGVEEFPLNFFPQFYYND